MSKGLNCFQRRLWFKWGTAWMWWKTATVPFSSWHSTRWRKHSPTFSITAKFILWSLTTQKGLISELGQVYVLFCPFINSLAKTTADFISSHIIEIQIIVRLNHNLGQNSSPIKLNAQLIKFLWFYKQNLQSVAITDRETSPLSDSNTIIHVSQRCKGLGRRAYASQSQFQVIP